MRMICEQQTKCVACKTIIQKGELIVKHHISYYPERTIPVHNHCHTKIHCGSDFNHLAPDPRQTIRFYKSKRHLLNFDFAVVSKFFKRIEKLERYNRKHGKRFDLD